MFGLYIHFPFCAKKCNYCDFLSGPVNDKALINKYLQALEQELEIYHGFLSRQKTATLKTVYLGGGTPTLLEAEQLVQVLEKCRDLFHFLPDTEITIEANPNTIDLDKLEKLRQAGVNRISIGVQSFDQDLLQAMGRTHSPAEAKESVQLAKAAGFKNLSIDLMYGLPDQTMAQWKDSLMQAVELDIQHLSVYGLKVEKGTAWGNLEEEGRLSLPDEDEILAMRRLANKLLAGAGFERYEISNYARPGFISNHNLGYWVGRPYLGLGLGASSDFWQRRFVNTSDLNQYISFLKKGQLPIKEEELLSFKQRMGETIFLGLRLKDGLDLRLFTERYGVKAEVIYSQEIDKLKKMGLITVNSGRLQLTPEALPIANYVFTFFV